MNKKITISPVTRIEGHARVTIFLNDEGKVDEAYLHIDQFRGFEKFSEGRYFAEMPIITPRICGICPVSHHLASVKATDDILGVDIPRPAKLLRELIHMGQIIQSHSMHFFELAGPDLILGWDADPRIRNVAGLIQANPELALKAVKLRKFGQRIIELVAGRRIHPIFAIPGGVNQALDPKVRDEILKGIDEMISYVEDGISIATKYIEDNKEVCDKFASFPTGYMGLVKDDGSLELYDGKIRFMDKNGDVVKDFKDKYYLKYIGERVEDWSYLKFPYYKSLGWPEGVYRVGPLGRLNVADKISTPIANEYLKNFKKINNGKPVEGSLYFHYARLIEAIYGLERTREILEDSECLSKDVLISGKVSNEEGIGVIEAPRGTLIHHYWVDEKGTIEKVNLIVATGHNNWAMSKSVESVAKEFVDGKNLTEGMLNRVEGAIRCYDPCLSCSTHAIGKMPLLIELYDSNGNLINFVKRD
ncbi:MAG TPA: Ni/Fe hydrogenase subunit alpha [Caldisericia bacterium]|nr:Ni/Fe hydrogenase subunit alpha [Caldisericia bacterium]HPB33961.1 Ni/Fe hydrogenase subunit alpha [Caldisericia bacterium]HQL66681.1 Ni/Fe hydrogenase subunit alpha [Caldisericia bacterium]HQN48111.1 Ni/Fe hydrogenase subunit alpha [Caldisericia bacterium]HQO99465.1 Ni/Fe hydrogenase subunit alpha [Caldisericia bacterium]